MATLWRDLAYAARYGHQQIPLLLGRPLTPGEFRLFLGALHELVVNDYNASPFGAPAPE